MASRVASQWEIQTRVIVADLGTRSGLNTVQTETENLDIGLLIAAAGFDTAGLFINADLAKEYDMLEVNCRADALGRKTTVVPGLLSKFLTYSLSALPRPARVRIMKLVMGGMTKHLHGKA